MEWFWQSCSGTRKLIGQSQGATAMLRPFESSSNYKSCNALCGRKGESAMPCNRSIQRTHHVYFQRLLQDRHTLCCSITVCGQAVILTNGELAAALFKFRFDGKYKKSLSFWRKRVYNKATANRN